MDRMVHEAQIPVCSPERIAIGVLAYRPDMVGGVASRFNCINANGVPRVASYEFAQSDYPPICN